MNDFCIFSYNYVAEKVSEATHAVTGDSNNTVKDKVNEKAEAHKPNLWRINMLNEQ